MCKIRKDRIMRHTRNVRERNSHLALFIETAASVSSVFRPFFLFFGLVLGVVTLYFIQCQFPLGPHCVAIFLDSIFLDSIFLRCLGPLRRQPGRIPCILTGLRVVAPQGNLICHSCQSVQWCEKARGSFLIFFRFFGSLFWFSFFFLFFWFSFFF